MTRGLSSADSCRLHVQLVGLGYFPILCAIGGIRTNHIEVLPVDILRRVVHNTWQLVSVIGQVTTAFFQVESISDFLVQCLLVRQIGISQCLLCLTILWMLAIRSSIDLLLRRDLVCALRE